MNAVHVLAAGAVLATGLASVVAVHCYRTGRRDPRAAQRACARRIVAGRLATDPGCWWDYLAAHGLDQVLADALADHAAQVDPRDALPLIQARTGRRSKRWWPW